MEFTDMGDFNKENVFRAVSQYYAIYLNSLNWNDEFYVSLQKMMRNKFMTLTYYKLMGGKSHKTCSEWVSSDALAVLNSDIKRFQGRGLWLEHVVPKQRYITDYCEGIAREGQIDAQTIFSVMNKCFILATITKEENDLLDANRLRNRMPDTWGENASVFTRYEQVGLKLMRNPHFGSKAASDFTVCL